MESKKRIKIFDIILSLAGAFALWAYVINVVNPPQSITIKDVPIQVLGVEAINATRLTIVGDGHYTCDVTVSASRSEIAGVTADDINATVNLEGLSAGQNYVIVKVAAPDHIAVEDIRSQKIQVYLEELVTEQRPLVISHAEIEGDYEVTITSRETDSVLVTGAKSLVAMVKEVRTDLDVASLSVDKTTTQRLITTPVDEDGNPIANVTLSHEKVYVSSAIYRVYDIPLATVYEGAPGLGAQLSKVEIPPTLKVKGKSSIISAIQSIETDLISIAGITDDYETPVKYHLPESVYLADVAEQPVAKFTLVHTGEISFTYGKDEILVRNVPEDCIGYEIAESGVTVTAKGDLSVIRKLEAKDLQPFIDLSEIVAGENLVDLETSFTSNKVTLRMRPAFVTVTAEMEEELPPEEGLEGEEGEGAEGGEGEGESPSEGGENGSAPENPEGSENVKP